MDQNSSGSQQPSTSASHQGLATGSRASRAAHIEGAGMDLDPSRRPGVPRMHAPKPLPNTHYPPARQHSDVKVFMHGRPHKTFPPVFGTDVPPKGLSGKIREAAYHYPDHYMRHWTLLLFADRVDSWEHRARKVVPALVLGVVGWAAFAAMGRRR